MQVDVTMDEAYLRTFHAEMVATRLPRWRLHQRVAWGSIAGAVVLAAVGLGSDRAESLFAAVLAALVGAGMLRRLHRRRERWLANQRRLPTFGAKVSFRIHDHQLVQTSDRSSDVLAVRRGELLETPSGWFVTYDIVHLGTEPDDETVDAKKASMFLPMPPDQRDAFAEALDLTFAIRRR